MKIEITTDSPILLKLTPETPQEAFNNGVLHECMMRMGLSCVKPDAASDEGMVVINIDDTWSVF